MQLKEWLLPVFLLEYYTLTLEQWRPTTFFEIRTKVITRSVIIRLNCIRIFWISVAPSKHHIIALMKTQDMNREIVVLLISKSLYQNMQKSKNKVEWNFIVSIHFFKWYVPSSRRICAEYVVYKLYVTYIPVLEHHTQR